MAAVISLIMVRDCQLAEAGSILEALVRGRTLENGGEFFVASHDGGDAVSNEAEADDAAKNRERP